ncbi:MAG: CPBP family intramembrane metalloprotease [Caldiserica bacterium]|nr:CPBP family intramembrane metalloprotease [Caldisericota bacterium]
MDSTENNTNNEIVVQAVEQPKRPKAGDWFELISYPVLGFVFCLLVVIVVILAIVLPIAMLSGGSFLGISSYSSSDSMLKGLVSSSSAQALVIFLLAVTEAGMVVPVFLFGFSFKKFSWESFGLKPLKLKWQWVLESLAIVVAVNGFEMLIEFLQTKYGFRLPEISKSNLDILNPTSRSIWLYLIFLFSIGILGPICEEILFRGAIYGWFRRYYKPWVGILVSSLFFGILHYETMLRMIFAISIGAYMAWMYEREKNLAAPITLHILNNSLVVTLMFLFPNL